MICYQRQRPSTQESLNLGNTWLPILNSFLLSILLVEDMSRNLLSWSWMRLRTADQSEPQLKDKCVNKEVRIQKLRHKTQARQQFKTKSKNCEWDLMKCLKTSQNRNRNLPNRPQRLRLRVRKKREGNRELSKLNAG